MNRDTVILFLSLLALLAQIIVAATLIALVARLLGRPRLLDELVTQLGPFAGLLAWIVAFVATMGSLYFSERAHFIPCKLCWYQRTAMYPLTIVLGVAAWRRRLDVAWYAIPVAAAGSLISVYHILVERFPSIESSVCDVSNPCTVIWTKRFGYETIPTMALSGFALIITLLALGLRYEHQLIAKED